MSKIQSIIRFLPWILGIFFICLLPLQTKGETREIKEHESIFPEATKSLATSHFTWGADVGSSIDLRGYDFSTFDLDVIFGYKNSWIRTIGIGGGIHRSFGADNTFLPVYMLFRTSFRSRPSLCFFNLKAGYSFNTVHDTESTKGGINVSIGVGFNLAMSKRFQSHIILSYGFFHMTEAQRIAANMTISHVDQAQIRIGVNF